MPARTTSTRTVRIGSHVPVKGGLVKGAFPFATDIGATAIQVFVGNPRGWALSDGDAHEDAEFGSLCHRARMPVFVHTPYLVNLGSPTPATAKRSIDAVAHNLARAHRIGARGIVVHTGSCVSEGGYESAMKQVREALLPILDGTPADGPALLLEPTAGQGRSLCAGLDDLPDYLDALERHPRLGICLDTCHLFAAGAPLDRRGGMTRTLDRLAEVAAPVRLQLVHANDSKDPCGSMRDRHERIGRGSIGPAAFRALLRHRTMRDVPLVLETPGGREAWAEDIALLQSFVRQHAPTTQSTTRKRFA